MEPTSAIPSQIMALTSVVGMLARGLVVSGALSEEEVRDIIASANQVLPDRAADDAASLLALVQRIALIPAEEPEN